jgi:protocatechuate 3,4-dioxygenase beta subunit
MPLTKSLTRREALGALGFVSAAAIVGCGDDNPIAPTTANAAVTTTTTGTTSAACAVTPSETVGPYPSLTDMFRSDIREDRQGVPLTLTINVNNATQGCAPLSGATVDVWQCDAEGRYSQYSQQGFDGRASTFLRGMQTTDASGRVTFMTIFPGWYQGRATHIHVEVTMNGRSLKVTQIAFPESVNAEVYGSSVYAARGTNPTSNTRDGIFADSLAQEMATVSGSASGGYAATFTVNVNA